jgi:DNA-binding winged helix-turn-helix (wHTH) protein
MKYAFGPFELDALSRRLERQGEPVAVPDRHIDILLLLVARAGQVISKDALVEAAWKGVAVTDNSLEQAISSLRRVLGQMPAAPAYIETLARRGYRFSAPVTRAARRHSSESLDALLAPHQAFLEGRAALESFDRNAVTRACGVFEEIIRSSPDYAPAHLGLANALALRFESTRADRPDRSALVTAVHHAAEACRLDPSSGEAWAALGFISHQARDAERAVAAARRATALEGDNWRHHLRLAYVSWGEERLRAAHRALKLLPGVALAHWLAATVHIARQAFAEAEQELIAGAEAQDRQDQGGRFTAVGLHFTLGLVRLAAADAASAIDQFNRELASAGSAHIYAREACANASCAVGALQLRGGATADAVAAFDRALELVPGHVVAMAARIAIAGDADALTKTMLDTRMAELDESGATIEAALAKATFEAVSGRHAAAARLVHDTLSRTPPGNGGWTVPVDPLLNAAAHPEPWGPVLAILRNRAA